MSILARLLAGFVCGVAFMFAGSFLIGLALGAGPKPVEAFMAATFGLAALVALTAASTRRAWGRFVLHSALLLCAIPFATAAVSGPVVEAAAAVAGPAGPDGVWAVAGTLAAISAALTLPRLVARRLLRSGDLPA